MFENISRYWAQMSLVALAIVAIFNIGYFGRIGMHFIGVVDLSNVVYSFALVFGFLIGLMVFFSGTILRDFDQFARRPDAIGILNRLSKWAVGIASVLFAIGLFLGNYITTSQLFAIWFTLASLGGAAYWWVLWRAGVPFSPIFSLGAVAMIALTISLLGSVAAEHEAFSGTPLYDVSTKSGVLDGVRIVRSSSNGFILSRARRIFYIPSGEVRSIVSSKEI